MMARIHTHTTSAVNISNLQQMPLCSRQPTAWLLHNGKGE
jgi:hypothetical protein